MSAPSPSILNLRRERRARACRIALCLVGVAAAISAAAADAPVGLMLRFDTELRSASVKQVLLAVRVNGEAVEEFAPLLKDSSRYYARAVDLANWRLQPAGELRIEGSDAYYPLDPALTHLDSGTQTLSLDVPANAFLPQHIDLHPASETATAVSASPGLALDYDLSLQGGGGRPQAAALLDAGVFGLPGIDGTLRHRTVLRNSDSGPALLRLDTQWRNEDSAQMRTWALGDSVSCAGEFGGAARFGGVQVQRDFGLRPDLVTFPLPTLSGSASVPTAVDLLVNGRAAGSAAVGAGPFQIDNPPLVSGAGNITVVQQDVLGRAQQLSVPYYVSPRLLKPGLTDYCLEAGRLREDYGVASSRYGSAFSAVGGRVGLRPDLTVLGRVEVGTVSSVELGAHWLAGGVGIVSTQAALSHSDAGTGGYAQLRFERQASAASLVASAEFADSAFRRLGGDSLPDWRLTFFSGAPLGRMTLAGALVWQRETDGATHRIASVNLAASLPAGWFGNLVLQKHDADTLVLAGLSRSFDELGHAALQTQSNAGKLETSMFAQQAEPLAGGLGWQAFASSGDAARQQLGASWLGTAGRASIEAAHADSTDATALRLGARGGLVWFDDVVVATRGLGEGSLARVSVAGLAGVPVLYQHRVVAVTDATGHAWISGLLPYQTNAIGIDAEALPLDVQIDRDEVQVKPPARAAVALAFPLLRSRAALVSVVDGAGRPIPPGARARLENGAHERTDGGADAPFGLHGEVYLEQVAAHNRLDIRWDGHACTLEFAVPASADTPIRVGPLVCAGAI